MDLTVATFFPASANQQIITLNQGGAFENGSNADVAPDNLARHPSYFYADHTQEVAQSSKHQSDALAVSQHYYRGAPVPDSAPWQRIYEAGALFPFGWSQQQLDIHNSMQVPVHTATSLAPGNRVSAKRKDLVNLKQPAIRTCNVYGSA